MNLPFLPERQVGPVLLAKGLQVFDPSVCTLHNTASDLGTRFTAKGVFEWHVSGRFTAPVTHYTTKRMLAWRRGGKNQTKAWRGCPANGMPSTRTKSTLQINAYHIVPCPIWTENAQLGIKG